MFTGNYQLSILLDHAQKGRIELPSHHRGLVWEESWKKDYINRLLSPDLPSPVGGFVLYRLEGGQKIDGVLYINDGWQRLGTLCDCASFPSKYGIAQGELEEGIELVPALVQVSEYKSHEEAYKDYLFINIIDGPIRNKTNSFITKEVQTHDD